MTFFFRGFGSPKTFEWSRDLAAGLAGADIVLGVMPSHHARGLYTAMVPHLTPSMILVSATKGLEQSSLLRISQVIEQVVGAKFPPRWPCSPGRPLRAKWPRAIRRR